MKTGFFFLPALFMATPVDAASPIQFKPAVLNAALLFNHDPSVGHVKHSLQWIRNSAGELQAMTDVWYDRTGCFTRVNMVNKINGTEFHLENKDGGIISHKGQYIAGKVNQACQLTELENESGKYRLSYNPQGLLETVTRQDTGKVITRYEYRYGQFPVRVRDYENHTDSILSYHAGNPQFLDFQSSLKTGENTTWLKQSCSYQTDGNARLCSIVTAEDENYREGAVMMFSNHQATYY
ncbi:YnfC family lipoprotein [Pantoea sp. FN060301]|uniref:YnfC family lipoprotein n=1 Tax=Pantoea sp. FN060301 TaxID=3420380 RepID=UPI003D179EC3